MLSVINEYDFECPKVLHRVHVVAAIHREFHVRQLYHFAAQKSHRHPSPLTVDVQCRCLCVPRWLLKELVGYSGNKRFKFKLQFKLCCKDLHVQ